MKVFKFNVEIPKNLLLDAKANFEVLSLVYDGADLANLTDIELLSLELIKQYLKVKDAGELESITVKELTK